MKILEWGEQEEIKGQKKALAFVAGILTTKPKYNIKEGKTRMFRGDKMKE